MFEGKGGLCVCSEPFVQLCSGCTGPHVSRAPAYTHSLEPFASRDFLRGPKDIPRYRARRIAVHLANSALDQNLTQLAVRKSFLLSIQSTVNSWVAKQLSSLSTVEAQLVADLTACKEKTWELAFTASPVVDSDLVAMVVGPNHSNEEVMRTGLCMFQSQIAHEPDIESLLEKTVQYQVTSCPLRQPANSFNSVVGQQGVQGSKAAGEPCTGSQSALPAPSAASPSFV